MEVVKGREVAIERAQRRLICLFPFDSKLSSNYEESMREKRLPSKLQKRNLPISISTFHHSSMCKEEEISIALGI